MVARQNHLAVGFQSGYEGQRCTVRGQEGGNRDVTMPGDFRSSARFVDIGACFALVGVLFELRPVDCSCRFSPFAQRLARRGRFGIMDSVALKLKWLPLRKCAATVLGGGEPLGLGPQRAYNSQIAAVWSGTYVFGIFETRRCERAQQRRAPSTRTLLVLVDGVRLWAIRLNKDRDPTSR